jgi:hypothetical protein
VVAGLTDASSVSCKLAGSRCRRWHSAGHNVSARWYCLRGRVGLARQGLYATIVPLLAYALFGPSRILVLGPDSSLAAVILGVVFPLSGGDAGRAVALAGMMALVSGIVCILAGVARLGFVTELLSKPIRYGYMNGIALTVLISQVPKFFGFSVEDAGPFAGIMDYRQAHFGWKSELDGICDWRRHVGGNSAAQEQHALFGNTCCCSWRDGNRWYAGLGGACERVGARPPPTGSPYLRDSVDCL